MKKSLLATLLCVSLLVGLASTSHAQVKIGTVDMNKIFSAYYKTKDAEARINEARNSAKQELDERMDTYKKNLDQINRLNDDIANAALSKETKDAKSKQRDDLIQETKNLEREITEFRETREKQLQEQAVRMRNGIVDEITKLVLDKVKSENYDLVMDRSGLSLNGVPILIFAKDGLDFSDDIVVALNKNKPKDSDTGAATPASPATPAATPLDPLTSRLSTSGKARRTTSGALFLSPPVRPSAVNITLAELATLTGGVVENGSPDTVVSGGAAVTEATDAQVTFFGNARYLPALKQSQAAAAFVPLDFAEQIAPALIKVANPSLAFATALEKFAPAPVVYAPGVHPTAVIGPEVKLGEGVSIQPYAVIEAGAAIGEGSIIGAHGFIGQESILGAQCHIHPHVTIRERTLIGARVVVHSGTVIGSDGFGYQFSAGRHVKIPQTGCVQIDDDVEIGANVTIDRARFGRTWIQEGTKIDNLVQIAHNVIIGRHSIIVSQTGISGSSKLGQYVTLAGQVGLVGHIEIGDRVIVGAKSGVSKDIPAGETWFGYPATPIRESKERLAYINRLEKLYARVRKLEQVLDANGISSAGQT